MPFEIKHQRQSCNQVVYLGRWRAEVVLEKTGTSIITAGNGQAHWYEHFPSSLTPLGVNAWEPWPSRAPWDLANLFKRQTWAVPHQIMDCLLMELHFLPQVVIPEQFNFNRYPISKICRIQSRQPHANNAFTLAGRAVGNLTAGIFRRGGRKPQVFKYYHQLICDDAHWWWNRYETNDIRAWYRRLLSLALVLMML